MGQDEAYLLQEELTHAEVHHTYLKPIIEYTFAV